MRYQVTEVTVDLLAHETLPWHSTWYYLTHFCNSLRCSRWTSLVNPAGEMLLTRLLVPRAHACMSAAGCKYAGGGSRSGVILMESGTSSFDREESRMRSVVLFRVTGRIAQLGSCALYTPTPALDRNRSESGEVGAVAAPRRTHMAPDPFVYAM
jgi:hypothetical protein